MPRAVLRVGAAVFLLAMAGYSAASIYYNPRRFPPATLGAATGYVAADGAVRIDRVDPAGPAARAGLREGDRIHAVNGWPLATVVPFWNAIDRGQPGTTVHLSVRRAGEPAVREVAVQLDPYRLPAEVNQTPLTTIRFVALIFLTLYPLPFFIVAAFVLVQRVHDRHAWLLALMFGGFIVSGLSVGELAPVIHPALRRPLLAMWALFGMVPPGALYCFFAGFPEPTWLDRRLPWLKAVLLGPPLIAGVLLSALVLMSPGPLDLSPAALAPGREAAVGLAFALYSAAGYGLGLASLVMNSFVARPEIRRRTRVMLWGTAIGVLSVVVLVVYIELRGLRGTQILSLPFWVWVGPVLALYLLPLSFAYAIVRYRVMELPVLLRRSARYLVVHHAIVVVGSVIGVALTFVFAWAFTRVLPIGSAGALSAGPLSGLAGAAFGVLVAVATRGAVRRATERVDRAFFRGAYDARRLLQDLARETRAASDRRQLTTLLEGSLKDALHPSSIVVLFRTASGRLEPVTADGSPTWSIDAAEVEREPVARAAATVLRSGDLPASLAPLAIVQPDLLVPMQGIDEHLEGMLVLGPRLSDEPYGREDRELVASVANQAGTVLENLRLATAVAERLEAERVAGRELEIAREVQSKLLPQHSPVLESLDYFGVCVQARLVGGDYYDFLYLGPGRLGLVLADISGKGISAALLMASLQASLRSQYAQAPDDLPRVLRAVNRTFFDSTATSRYATLFFAIYDETTSRLRYANCGHPPPVLLGPDGAIDRLQPTGTVIGLFDEWDCRVQEIDLKPGDTLVMFTDGVAEAFNEHFEEFGEERIVDLIRARAELPAVTMVEALVEAVQRHSGPAQSDDFTVVVARGRAPGIDPEPIGLRRGAS
ncbi:MAG TPA: SpoIIE family protein phosphatase [Vicinamibacterales bacterium]|nr:SpoIIE family protein phosphatase [Vicinamibacterales bacterium]